MGSKDTGSAVYNILAFVLAGKDTAKQTFDDAKYAAVLDGYDIAAQAWVSQNEKGKVHIHEPGHGTKGAVIGGAIGGALALIGGPVGVLALAASGAAIGGVAGHLNRAIPKEDLKEIGDALTPDSSAMLLLLEDTYSEGVVNDMSGTNANVVTLTVGDDLSGEIQSYVAGQATDAAGDEVDAAGGVAADAAGDVAAAGAVAASSGDDKS
jgi:uncharacterized membrane protein